MMRAKALDRPDAKHAAVRPDAEQADRRVEQPRLIEREAMLRRGLGPRELQVPFQERLDLRPARVVFGNPLASHPRPLRSHCFSAVKSCRWKWRWPTRPDRP